MADKIRSVSEVSKSRIAAFSKYLTYSIGGAEISTMKLLSEHVAITGQDVLLVSVPKTKFIGKMMPLAMLPPQWRSIYIDGGIWLPRLSYLEYFINRKKLFAWFNDLVADELWVYGTLAPAAVLGFNGPCRYFIRSETDLAIFANYYRGIKKVAKSISTLAEYPATKIFCDDLILAFHRSRVVANSKYMAARLHSLFGVIAEVVYPPVDVTDIHRKLKSDVAEKKWVVFVGDSPVKGIHHVLRAAQNLPNANFRIVSRFVSEPCQVKNISWIPWRRDVWRIYSGACLVIVPSQWEEAYGRVAREAYLLGIPVLVSAVGGLPEAVDGNSNCLVEDYQNPLAWQMAIAATILSACAGGAHK